MNEINMSGASPVLMPRDDPAGKIVFAIVLLVFLLVCLVALRTFLDRAVRNRRETAAIRASATTACWAICRLMNLGSRDCGWGSIPVRQPKVATVIVDRLESFDTDARFMPSELYGIAISPLLVKAMTPASPPRRFISLSVSLIASTNAMPDR